MKRIAMQARRSWTLLRCCIAVHLPDCRSFGGQCSCKETWPRFNGRRVDGANCSDLVGGPKEPHSHYLVVQRVLRCSANAPEFSLSKLWITEIKCLFLKLHRVLHCLDLSPYVTKGHSSPRWWPGHLHHIRRCPGPKLGPMPHWIWTYLGKKTLILNLFKATM